jgi:hypothetical protein
MTFQHICEFAHSHHKIGRKIEFYQFERTDIPNELKLIGGIPRTITKGPRKGQKCFDKSPVTITLIIDLDEYHEWIEHNPHTLISVQSAVFGI